LCDQLIARLKSTTDPMTGKGVVLSAWRKDELFSGPRLDRIPDILLMLDESVVMRTEPGSDVWGETPESDLRDISGDHDMDGIFAACGPGVGAFGSLERGDLLDIAPTLLCALGQPIPENMDGKAMTDVFVSDFRATHEPVFGEARPVMVAAGENVYSDAEEDAIRKRLQDLGYLGE
jgi:predicted AlkP superfamily phosphohydrolase/phosphomutase